MKKYSQYINPFSVWGCFFIMLCGIAIFFVNTSDIFLPVMKRQEEIDWFRVIVVVFILIISIAAYFVVRRRKVTIDENGLVLCIGRKAWDMPWTDVQNILICTTNDHV